MSVNSLNHYILSDSCRANSILHYDLHKINTLYNDWCKYLPKVKPYYAVKCNSDIELLKTLRDLDINFDCASASEIKTCLDLGINYEQIIYANPCKFKHDIVYACNNGVNTMTFDSIYELEKIKELPFTQYSNLIMRIYANDTSAQCNLSDKYGAEIHEWESLLERAHDLNMNIVGISFHIGSGAKNPDIYKEALKQCRKLYEMAILYGFDLSLIDIGGGFTVNNFKLMASTINDALDMYFPDEMGCKVIAEPGRYFAESIATLYTKIIGKRIRQSGRIDYIAADSLYGLFNCKLYDHSIVQPPEIVLGKNNISRTPHNPKIQHQTRIMGCTCDSIEILFDEIYLPEMEPDDWIKINNFGAYTISAASCFNGINFKDVKCIYDY
jgi:ornithine decarboxylase